jgi:OOP family OmpA-OmpF porin
MRWRARLAALALLTCGGAQADPALDAALAPPEGAVVTFAQGAERDGYDLPVRAFGEAGGMIEQIEGRVSRRAFRLRGDETTLALIREIQARLVALDFETVLLCADSGCGGYDFRFGVTVLPPPAMSVNLADFRQLTMRRAGDEGAATVVSVLASRIGGALHVQEFVVEAARPLDAPPPPQAAPEADPGPGADPPPAATGGSLIATLDAAGHVVLEGIEFVTGSSDIAPGSGPALDAAAAALSARPDLNVIVVGHTDASGDLALNQQISAARAAAVANALAERGVAKSRLSSAGVAFLAPRAPNATEAGRAANRRVELVAR